MVDEKSCGAVVFLRENGKILFVLVLQRNGQYSFPKGHMESGETEKQTALREIWEETGLRPVILEGFREVEKFMLPRKPGCMKEVVYFLAESSGQNFDPKDTDAVAAELFDFEDALDMLPSKSRRDVLIRAKVFLDRMGE